MSIKALGIQLLDEILCGGVMPEPLDCDTTDDDDDETVPEELEEEGEPDVEEEGESIGDRYHGHILPFEDGQTQLLDEIQRIESKCVHDISKYRNEIEPTLRKFRKKMHFHLHAIREMKRFRVNPTKTQINAHCHKCNTHFRTKQGLLRHMQGLHRFTFEDVKNNFWRYGVIGHMREFKKCKTQISALHSQLVQLINEAKQIRNNAIETAVDFVRLSLLRNEVLRR